ncbi:choice-of-anchor J domain-containing protein [uncultured Muribaculum sp.]|uniref:choice-of-anchor J domain-containing protein n=1 Tax=uncultured Muribaculum sp. TaxID=1918613 RepID=UPI0025CCC3CF|nr:choice-of-anchor J domain-containing protein [uncultured Muribaculum sp.]
MSTLDVNTGQQSPVGSLPQKFPTLAFDKSGKLYGLGADCTLYTIDKATGAVEALGATGISVSGNSSLCFDNDGTTLYYFVGSDVYTVDTADGSATKVADFGGRMVQWSAVFALPVDKGPVPTWVDNLTIDFPKGSLSGHVTMKMPATSVSGTPLSETLTYHLLVDGEDNSGDAAPGEDISIPLTLEAGTHEFVAYAECNGNAGMEGRQSVYIGHDIPMAPQNVTVSGTGASPLISWIPSTGGVNGGYIDMDALAYIITRDPGEVVVAEGVKDASWTDATIDAMNYYTYKVVASDGVNTSEQAVSTPVLLGKEFGVNPPFSYVFDNQGFGLFTFEDANNDGFSWMYSENLVWFMLNPQQDSDDWLMSPPITLEKGKHYNLKLNILGSVGMEIHRVDVCLGKDATPESMTNNIRTSVFRGYAALDEWIVPEEDGEYYFGLHVLTPKGNGAISITDFYIGAGYNATVPGTVSGLEVKAAPMGAMQATVSFKCPTIDFAGNELGAIKHAVLTNTTTGTVVKVFENPAPGAVLEAVDEAPAQGNNTYSVTCDNDSGDGMPVESTCWIGVDLPGAPVNVRWIQDGEFARLTWEAPAAGQHGGYMDVSKLQYHVSVGDSPEPIGEATDGFSADFKPELENPQDVLQFNVWAVNETGAGTVARSNQSAFGTPYQTPFYESFEMAALHSTPWLRKIEEGYNAMNVVTYVEGLNDINGVPVTAFDNDGGMLVYSPFTRGVTCLEMPIVDISGLSKPVMKMWVMFFDDQTEVKIKGNNNSGTEWTDLEVIRKGDKPSGWNLVVVPIDKFKGESRLQLCVQCSTPGSGTYVLFDRISIEEGFDTDLMVAGVDFPSKIYAGKTFNTSVKVANAGLKASPACEVQVLIDDKLAASMPLASLPPSGVATIDLESFLSSNATSARVQAQIYCMSDEDKTNNALVANLQVVRSALPAPVGLGNTSESSSEVRLSWTAPECRYNAPVTDSFETLEAGSVGGIDVKRGPDGNMIVNQNIGWLNDYKLVDNDMLATTTTAPMMGTPNSQNGMVCQVVDVVEFNLRGTSTIWEAHSGNKLLAFWQSKRYDPETGKDSYDEPNDDWLILPKLSEDDKFISFWAKSLTEKYGLESFEIMVSLESDDIADFERFTYASNIPAGYATDAEHGYVYYEFDLPEETQYVAIRYNSAGTMALLVDDLSYTPADNMVDIELLGYNVYRDGTRINDEPLKSPEFVDRPESDGSYRYNVTALFAEGESPYSNTVTVSGYSGILDVNAGSEGGCSIKVEGRYVVIAADAPVAAAIYSPDGRMLRSAGVDGEVRIGMEPGIYIVKAGDVSRSVIIK